MEPRTWKKSWSRLLKGKAIEVETPELYLKLTTRCMEQVNRLCSTRGFPMPKFNQEQCMYLATKLQLAIQSANSIMKDNIEFSSLAHPKKMEQLLEIFRLLNAMGLEVEDLVQNCCKEEWIQSAIMLMDMLEQVATIALNLEFCTNIFFARQPQMRTTLTQFDATRIRKAEVQIIKEKANLDEAKLIMDLRNVIHTNASSSAEWQLATFLLGRLETSMLPPNINSPRSEGRVFPPMIMSLQQMQDCLGKGAFGSVHKALWLGVEVAKKTFYGPTSADFLREASILDGLNHPNVVSLLWSMMDGKKCHLVMELMDGDLFTLMHQRMEAIGNQGSPFHIQEALDLILQIGEGMLYLHGKRIVHRDLKSHNILIRCRKMAKTNVKYLDVKVADFGLSRTKERSATYSDMSLNVGTTRWMAPEVMRAGMRVGNLQSGGIQEATLNYPFKIDIYSFAMVCYEILTGDVPFSNLSHGEVKNAVLNGYRPPLPRECPYRLRTLIQSCWSTQASTRPSFGTICEELRDLKYAKLRTCWEAMFYHCPLEDMLTIDELFSKLSNPIADVQRTVANEIHLLAKKSFDHQIYIKKQEAMPLLVLLSYSRDLKTREHAITTLQALAIDDWNPITQRDSLKELSLRRNTSSMSSFSKEIYLDSALGPIVEVLNSGRMKARKNAAKALVNMSSDLAYKVEEKIRNSNVVPALMTLLQDGSMEGKECAAIVLLWTCRFQQDYERVIQAGIVPPLMNLIAQQSDTVLDNALKMLSILAHYRQGLIAIAEVKPTLVSVLVKFIASESRYRWKRDRAAQILLKLCLHDPRFVEEAKEANVVEHLTHFVRHPPSSSTSEPSARALLQLLQKQVDDL